MNAGDAPGQWVAPPPDAAASRSSGGLHDRPEISSHIAPGLSPTDGIASHWRSSTARLILLYGAFFVGWTIVLVLAINWQTSRYLESIVDQLLEQRAQYLATVEPGRLREMLAATSSLDLRGVMSYGLFDVQGNYLYGDIDHLPPGLPVDGQVHALPNNSVQRLSGERGSRTRGVALQLDGGLTLLLARDYSTIDRVGQIIRDALFWALTLTLVPGLFGGFLLSRGPLRRVREVETAIQPIMRGDLGARLPLSGRDDELDMFAVIVNRMLEQLERLLGEVKGVSDSIAHDLRTPLTRLRAQLYRLQRAGVSAETSRELIEHCIIETDTVLDRFRALLRISELEDLRRQAGFRAVDTADILHRVHELYAPLAEDKGVAFELQVGNLPAVRADAELLFEAVTNLVSNALKFTPKGGKVLLHGSADARGLRIDVLDDGPGIPESERGAVLQRFYRTERGKAPGFGLGLSIVAAIVKLHGFQLEIGDSNSGGTRMTIHAAT